MKNQLRILCADDEDTCELLTTTLGFSNIEVKSAHTVADAWRLAQTEPFDLYLLETRLPDGDGFGRRSGDYRVNFSKKLRFHFGRY
ncbi:MAG: response regulator [Acidobacteria bacterium]|nr:response regulator [Acidobacteriota bacterium]